MKRILTIALFIVACQPSTTPVPKPSAVVAPQVEAPKMAPVPQSTPVVLPMNGAETVGHIYENPGIYTITVVQKDGAGHEQTFKRQIVIMQRRRRAVRSAMGAE